MEEIEEKATEIAGNILLAIEPFLSEIKRKNNRIKELEETEIKRKDNRIKELEEKLHISDIAFKNSVLSIQRLQMKIKELESAF
jgi:methionine aminopeptidase